MIRIGLVSSVACFLVLVMASAGWSQGAKQYSVNSMIVEVEGSACLGQEHSRIETEKLAMAEAKRVASERVMTHISSETNVKDGLLEDDLLKAYSQATVRILDEIEKGWQQSDGSGGFVDACYRVKIKAEVVPAKVESAQPTTLTAIGNPKAPLTVELWTDKETYHLGEAMKFYFRGNKPFYARAVYEDVEGHFIEVTPYHKSRYYKGGVIYEIPGKEDLFTLMITPPLGDEKLVLFTSTQPMNNYSGKEAGGLYVVRGGKNLGDTSRGLTVLEGVQGAGKAGQAEFAEVSAKVRVEK